MTIFVWPLWSDLCCWEQLITVWLNLALVDGYCTMYIQNFYSNCRMWTCFHMIKLNFANNTWHQQLFERPSMMKFSFKLPSAIPHRRGGGSALTPSGKHFFKSEDFLLLTWARTSSAKISAARLKLPLRASHLNSGDWTWKAPALSSRLMKKLLFGRGSQSEVKLNHLKERRADLSVVVPSG